MVDSHTWRPGIFDSCNKTAPNINHAVVLDGFGSEKLGLGVLGLGKSWNEDDVS